MEPLHARADSSSYADDDLSQTDSSQQKEDVFSDTLEALCSQLRASLQAKDHEAAKAILAKIKDRYTSAASVTKDNFVSSLQAEVAISDIVYMSSLELETYIHRLVQEIGKSSTEKIIRLLPQSSGRPIFSEHFPSGVNVDLCALASKFQASYPTHFSPNISISLYAQYAAYCQIEDSRHQAEPKKIATKPKKGTFTNEAVPERQRYEVVTMKGAELQEQRKLALLQKITTLSRSDFYPLAFLFLKTESFTQTIHTLFDIAQLYAEGSVSIRKYTDKEECQRIYAVHNISIDSAKYEYESLYIRSKEAINAEATGNNVDQNRAAYLHEFSPTIWKGLSSVLSMDMARAQSLCKRFGII